MGATGVGATGVAYDDDGLEDGVVKGVASVLVKIGGVGPLLGKDVGLLVVPGPPHLMFLTVIEHEFFIGCAETALIAFVGP